MYKEKINLNGGVIIIGSLLWEDDLNHGDKLRKTWRENSLEIENKILAKLPIRYGRYSRSGIYTMVFSTNCERRKTLSTGYIIPFKKNPINSIDILIAEAREMSNAEGMNGKFVGGNQKLWSSMGIILNNDKLEKKLKEFILKKWEENFINDGGSLDLKDYKIGREKQSISRKGELQINWPKALNSKDTIKIDRLDFLLATSTKPKHKKSKLKKYPNVYEIAESIQNDNTRDYFLNNFKHNIITFNDVKIINKLNNAL